MTCRPQPRPLRGRRHSPTALCATPLPLLFVRAFSENPTVQNWKLKLLDGSDFVAEPLLYTNNPGQIFTFSDGNLGQSHDSEFILTLYP